MPHAWDADAGTPLMIRLFSQGHGCTDSVYVLMGFFGTLKACIPDLFDVLFSDKTQNC